MPFPLVIFDLDGTILDTLKDLHASVNVAMDAFAMPQRSLREVRSFVGNGIRRLIELCVPKETSVEIIDQVQTVFSAHYKLHCNDRTRPYDGIPELIHRLRQSGCKTAVVSNKDDDAVRALCELHFPGAFDAVVGSREGVRKKPAPDSVNEVLSQLGFSRDKAVYIGDSEVDLQTANNIGMELISVSWGFRDESVLHRIGCRNIATSVCNLENMLFRSSLVEISIVERMICDRQFQYLKPYFYNHPYALRCELGIGESDSDYMEAAQRRASEIYDLLFPDGADAVIFNYWINDRSDSGYAESLDYTEEDDPTAFIDFIVENEVEQLRFLHSMTFRHRHLAVKNLQTYDESDELWAAHSRRNRIVCFSDGIGFDSTDLIRRQVLQNGDHDISFVSYRNECILSIYDDRGCDIVFMTKEKMKLFYPRLQPYFLDYDLEEMKRRFES